MRADKPQRLTYSAHWLFLLLNFPEQAAGTASNPTIKWCAVGHAETSKCDQWTINSVTEDVSAIECQTAPSVDECMKKIMVKQPFLKYGSVLCNMSSIGSILQHLFLIICYLNYSAA